MLSVSLSLDVIGFFQEIRTRLLISSWILKPRHLPIGKFSKQEIDNVG